MTAWEVAEWLSENVRARRLRRAGIDPSGDHVGFAGLPDDEQRTWLDVADAVLEANPSTGDPLVARLQQLAADWTRYTTMITDPVDRDSMRRAVVVELRYELRKLERECDYP